MKSSSVPARPNRHEAGFTLLEMLVALVIFGLLMAGLAQTFRFGLTAWPAATRRAAGPENMAAMDAALSRMIAEARPGSMTGRANGLVFTAPLPEGAGLQGRLADVAIIATADDALVLRYVQHPPGIPLGPAPAPRTEILSPGVAGLEVSYFGPQASGPAAWSNRWSGEGLPLLVRIHLRLTGGENWPDLVAAPVAQQN